MSRFEAGGNLIGVQNAAGALDGGHHAGPAHGDARRPLDALDLALAVDHVSGALGLWQADDVRLRAHDGFQIRNAQAGAQVVDPHDQFLAAVLEMCQRVVYEETSGVLFRNRNGILQVEHDAVRSVDVRIAHHAGIVARHKQHAAPKPFHPFVLHT